MKTLPPALQRLIDDLSRLPGIGKKTATRLALHILRRPASEAAALASDLAALHSRIHLCSSCFAFSEDNPCPICADPRRDEGIICVVEGPADLAAIEKSGAFRGHYHVLHGAISPMDGIGPRELRIDALISRLRAGKKVRELVIATSSTVPGEATAAYLMEKAGPTGVKISRLACGIPMGMEVRHADTMTLARALEGRSLEGC